MRKLCVLLSILISVSALVQAQSVGINDDGLPPDPKAMLDVRSAAKGFLIPRMNQVQRGSITNPPAGLIVYQTDAASGIYINSGTPTTPNWQLLTTANSVWSLTGNSGIDPTANFIGTTDDQPLLFKAGNMAAGAIDYPKRNIALGFGSLSNSSGKFNAAIGSGALAANTSGQGNTASGLAALTSNTTGSSNTADGDGTLYNNLSGEGNTGVGASALNLNTTGFYNTAVGYNANVSNGGLTNATAIGYNAVVSLSNAMVLGNSAVNVGIGTSSPNASSILDLTSNSRGLLIPRMSTTDRNNIVSPATGLMVYDNSLNKFYYYDGSSWAEVGSSAAANAWSLSGNSGTNPASNFVGTTDGQPLIFKVNNALAGQIHSSIINTDNYNTSFGFGALANTNFNPAAASQANFNVAMGSSALYYNTTGSHNVAIGLSALGANTTANDNTAVGSDALQSNTTGFGNTGMGRTALSLNTEGADNTAIGAGALYTNGSGNNNTAVGVSSLKYNQVGHNNTAVGYAALLTNVSSGNTAVGYSALMGNSTGDWNTAIGNEALKNNGGGTANTAAGYNALYNNTSGGGNTGVGLAALFANTTGYDNTAVGSDALISNTTGNSNTAVGTHSLVANTASGNTAVGANCLFNNSSGSTNTAVGSSALLNNSTGSANTALGWEALKANQTGITNTAIGNVALHSNTTGGGNTAVGNFTLTQNTTGTGNTAMGNNTLNFNNGTNNTAYGEEALKFNTTGNGNTAAGSSALFYLSTGSMNTALGGNAGVPSGSGALENTIAIGYGAVVSVSNTAQIGNSNITDVYFGNPAATVLHAGSLNTTSDARFKYDIQSNVPGLEFVTKLNPVTYYFDDEKLAQFVKTGVIDNGPVKKVAYAGAKQLHTGFLAQDVEKILQELGYKFDGLHTPSSNKDYYSLSYASFVVPLVKSVQEQQTIIEKQNDELKKLKEQVEALTKAVEKISSNK